MRYKAIILLLLTIVMTAGAVNTIEDANKAYESGDYDECIKIYTSIASEKGYSGSLYCNLGNAYVKAGDYGHAMLCYERGLKLNPSNGEIRDNIAYITTKVEENNKADSAKKNISVAAESESFLTMLKEVVVLRQSGNTWAVVGLILFLLTCACVAVYIFTVDVTYRKIGFFGSIVSFVISIIMISFAFISAGTENNRDYGVVTGYKVKLLQDSSATAKEITSPLNRGTKMTILTEEKEEGSNQVWYKVRLNSDYVGWISSSDFEVI